MLKKRTKLTVDRLIYTDTFTEGGLISRGRTDLHRHFDRSFLQRISRGNKGVRFREKTFALLGVLPRGSVADIVRYGYQ